MTVRRLIISVVSLFAVALPAAAQDISEKPIVRWYYQSFPPLHITDGPQSGQGFADKTLVFLHARLPGYNHLKVYSSLTRMHSELKARTNACHLGLFKTPEREEYAYFSDPVIEVMPNRLVVLKEKASRVTPFLNREREVDLDKLFAAQGLMYGVEINRVYSPRINPYIDRQTKADGKVELPSPRYAALLLHGRIDYGFAFAFEASFRFKMLGRGSAYMTLPIAGEPDVLENYVGCSKTEFGAQVIADINRVAADVRLAHRGFYEEWLDDRAIRDLRAAIKARDSKAP